MVSIGARGIRSHATPRRVLIIEDDADIRTVITDVLLSEGHSVAGAREGAEGLRRAREEHPDLILLDLMMPGMDGWAFRAAQREDAEIADIPVVIVSASNPADVHGIGAAAHLHKPFDLGALLDAVDRHAAR